MMWLGGTSLVDCKRVGRLVLAVCIGCGALGAQDPARDAGGPETSLRSAASAVSFALAPAAVARGGVLAVTGAGLAGERIVAQGASLPTALGEPATEVLVNGVAAPLYFASATQVNAQIPWGTQVGRALVVVRRGEVESDAVPVQVVDAQPELLTYAGSGALIAQTASGAGQPALDSSDFSPSGGAQLLGRNAAAPAGQLVTVFGVGLGETEPSAVTGAVAPEGGAAPVQAQRAYVGGVPADSVSASLSGEVVGVYELELEVPQQAASGAILRWYSGNASGSGWLGAPGPVRARFLAVPEAAQAPAQVDLTDLHPALLVLTGELDEVEFCYQGVHLFDFRRDAVSSHDICLLPSHPLAPSAAAYRPFEIVNHTPALAALSIPAEGFAGPGVTDRLLVVDGVSAEVRSLALTDGTDRLQPGFGNNPHLRLWSPGSASAGKVVDLNGAAGEPFAAAKPLPSPLLEGYGRVVAQPLAAGFGDGYRMRFVAPDDGEGTAGTRALLFNREAAVVANVELPDGWDPISPPRNINAQGVAVGNSFAPVSVGFGGEDAAYLVARSADGARDAVLSFRAMLPDVAEAEPPAAVDVEVSVLPFPDGSFAANCHPQVRWLRMPLTRSLLLAGSGAAASEFANPRDNRICVADRVIVFRPGAEEIRGVAAPFPLDVGAKGALADYAYFADGGREVALESPEKLQVFDAVQERFRQIEFPEGVGVTLLNRAQSLPGQGRLVALASGGPPRTNNRGVQLPPFPGNRGLLIIDLPSAEVRHLALPEGFQRVVVLPGNSPLLAAGRRSFGVLPLLGRVFARAMAPNAGPGNPGRSIILTWDLATGEAEEVELPEAAHWVVQPLGGGPEGMRPAIWDYKPRSETIAFGVYSRDRQLISVGVLGPE